MTMFLLNYEITYYHFCVDQVKLKTSQIVVVLTTVNLKYIFK